MARKSLICLGMVVSLVMALGAVGIAEDQIMVKDPVLRGEKFVPGEIVVKFKPGVGEQQIAALNARHGTVVISTSRFAGFKRLRVPKGKTVSQMVAIYSRNPNVEYAEPNFIAHAFESPNDPFYIYQWHLSNSEYGGIHMEEAWPISSGDGAVVAVIDTGVAYENYSDMIYLNPRKTKMVYYAKAPDLAETDFVAGYDFVNDDEHPNDDEGHGTHVAGTIAQSTNNGMGTAGVAYGCSIMPIKVLDSSGSGTYTDIADGIHFAADNGAHIINMSLGGSAGSITLENALAYAYNAGVTIVCASGNDGSATTISYPAAYDQYCIAVGATRYDEAVAYYSNRGPSLDLTAPGGDVTVDQNYDGYFDGVLQQTHNGSDYTVFGYYLYQGTSMATPHVSGVAALLVASGVATSPAEVREVLQTTADDKGVAGLDSEYGWGIVNAYAALLYGGTPNTPPVADAGGPYSGTEDISLQFTGTGSSDADSDTLTYSWNFGDGATGSGANTSHSYAAGGTYTVTLVVNDGKTDSTPDTATATIVDVNDAPLADAGLDLNVAVGETVTFDGSNSWDEEDGYDLTNYAWNFGDGSTESGVDPIHTYLNAGTYEVTLTVTDSVGTTGIDTATISVTDVAPSSMMKIGSVEMGLNSRTAGKNKFTSAAATITVQDSNNAAVPGATVNVSWSGATTDVDSATTDTSGTVKIYSDEVKNASETTFICTITGVTKAGWTYDDSGVTSASITVP